MSSSAPKYIVFVHRQDDSSPLSDDVRAAIKAVLHRPNHQIDDLVVLLPPGYWANAVLAGDVQDFRELSHGLPSTPPMTKGESIYPEAPTCGHVDPGPGKRDTEPVQPGEPTLDIQIGGMSEEACNRILKYAEIVRNADAEGTEIYTQVSFGIH